MREKKAKHILEGQIIQIILVIFMTCTCTHLFRKILSVLLNINNLHHMAEDIIFVRNDRLL